MYRAYLAVVEERQTVRRAAEAFNVPKSTLQDRISGRVVFGSRSGPQSYLTDEEEKELVAFIKGCSTIGFSRSKQQIIELMQQVMYKKGRDVNVSLGWWNSFRRRHSQLTVRTAEPVSYARSIGTRPEIISRYFDLLEDTLVENGLLEKPRQIFNMDETGMPLDPLAPKVICRKGAKHPVSTTTGDKTQITVVSCCSAGGYTMPPMVIFDRKTLKPELTRGEVPGTIYGLSSSGWIDSDLFCQWFSNHFLAYAPPSHPLLLLLDGHSAHFNPLTIELAAKEQVVVFCLPPHSSHRTQPLDKGCFGPLKQYWRQECHDYLIKNPGKVVSRYEFSELFSRAWLKGMSMSNILGGFKNTGVYPFNRGALLSQSPVRPSLSQRTGQNYIPLFSPVPSRPVRALTSVPEISTGVNDNTQEELGTQTQFLEVMPPVPFTPEEISLFERR